MAMNYMNAKKRGLKKGGKVGGGSALSEVTKKTTLFLIRTLPWTLKN